METSNCIESDDWRGQLQRQRIVNKIMDTLKKYLPFSEDERLRDLETIAKRVEDEVYTAATSQSEYSRKICFMMLTMETRLQNHTIQSNSVALNKPPIRFDSTANNGDWQEEVYQKIKVMKDLYLLGEDWQEEVYQKIRAMRDLYLPDLKYIYQKIISTLQQLESLPQQPEDERLGMLKKFKYMLERYMQFLHVPKHGVLPIYKEKLGTYERQLIDVIKSNKRKPTAPQQQAQALPPPHMQSLQQSRQTHPQSTQGQSHENSMNLQGSNATE